MNFRKRIGNASRYTALVLVTCLGLVSVSHAAKHKFALSNRSSAVVIEQPNPAFPEQSAAKGQEGWVRMHFVVMADGRATDPIIIDSSGGVGFEEEARKVVPNWRFEAPGSGAELPNNLINIRSETQRGKHAASPNFIGRYRSIVTDLHNEEIESARAGLDVTTKLGGWNLYESVMLSLMAGRVQGAEGDLVGKLESYRRALGISNRYSLYRNGRRDTLTKIFELQDQFGQYADAMRTFRLLKKEKNNRAEMKKLAPRAAEIEVLMESEETLTADATIYNPCNCDAGKPLWYYRPARRTFSFGNLDGNVGRFEARCENKRILGDVEEGKLWTLAPEWGSCRLFVFGDDGASFDFLEHLTDGDNASDEKTAVVRSHVLD